MDYDLIFFDATIFCPQKTLIARCTSLTVAYDCNLTSIADTRAENTELAQATSYPSNSAYSAKMILSNSRCSSGS